jgi:hypothetical protein
VDGDGLLRTSLAKMPTVLTRHDVEQIVKAITSKPMRLHKTLHPKVNHRKLEQDLNDAVQKTQRILLNGPARAAKQAAALRKVLLRTHQIIKSAELMDLLRLQNKHSMPTLSVGGTAALKIDADTLQAIIFAASEWLATTSPEKLAINIPRNEVLKNLITKVLPHIYMKHFQQVSCPNTVTSVATDFIVQVLSRARITNKHDKNFTPDAVVQRRKRLVSKITKTSS